MMSSEYTPNLKNKDTNLIINLITNINDNENNDNNSNDAEEYKCGQRNAIFLNNYKINHIRNAPVGNILHNISEHTAVKCGNPDCNAWRGNDIDKLKHNYRLRQKGDAKNFFI